MIIIYYIIIIGHLVEIFFLDLPNEIERQEIFKIHIQEFRPASWKDFNYSLLSKKSELFSGAEIRQTIIEAMYNAFHEQREFNTDDILFALNQLIPLANLESTQMRQLQTLASSGQIRLASSQPTSFL